MPKQLPQQQLGNLAQPTPAREWVRGQQKIAIIRLAYRSTRKKKEKSLFYTISRIGSWPITQQCCIQTWIACVDEPKSSWGK
jgi:hypothetical protein